MTTCPKFSLPGDTRAIQSGGWICSRVGSEVENHLRQTEGYRRPAGNLLPMVRRNEIGGASDSKGSGIEAPAPELNRSPS